MAETKDLIIQLSLENDKLKRELSSTEKTSKLSFDRIKKNALKIGAGLLASFGVIKKSFDFTKEFAAFQQASAATKKQFGLDANVIVKELNKISKGTISNTDLVLSANKALALGVTDNVETLSKILEIARVRGQALGLDTTQAFDDLVTGVGRGSPLILDNLGIITKGWDAEAKAQGVAYDKQFILNKVLADGADLLQKTGEVQKTAAERMQSLGASFDNAKVSLGEALLPVFETFVPIITDLVKSISKLPVGLKLAGAASFAVIPAFIAMNAALGPIGIAIAAVGIAVTALKVAYDSLDDSVEANADAELKSNQNRKKIIEEYEKNLIKQEELQKELDKINEKIYKKEHGFIRGNTDALKEKAKEKQKEIESIDEELKLLEQKDKLSRGLWRVEKAQQITTLTGQAEYLKNALKEKGLDEASKKLIEERIKTLSKLASAQGVNIKLTEEEQAIIDELSKTEENSNKNKLKKLEALRDSGKLTVENLRLVKLEIDRIKESIKLEEENKESIEKTDDALKQYGTSIQAVTNALSYNDDKTKALVNSMVELGLAIAEASKQNKAMKQSSSDNADQTEVNIQGTSDWVMLIIKLIAAIGEVAETSESAAVRGFGKFIKYGRDVKVLLKGLFPIISSITEGVGGMEDAWLNLIPIVGPVIQKIRQDAEELSDSISEEFTNMANDIRDEIARANFTQSLLDIDKFESEAKEAAMIASGLSDILKEEEADRRDDLVKSIEAETDAEKKSDLERNLAKLDAQKEYAELEKQIELDAEEQRKEVKRQQYAYEKEMRYADLLSSFYAARMEASSIVGKRTRNKAYDRIKEDYKTNKALLDAIPTPQFEQGGMISGLPGIGPEDGFIAVKNGESVLNQKATAELGADAINALNNGRNPMNTSVVINVNDGRGAVEILDNYFKTHGTSQRGLSL